MTRSVVIKVILAAWVGMLLAVCGGGGAWLLSLRLQPPLMSPLSAPATPGQASPGPTPTVFQASSTAVVIRVCGTCETSSIQAGIDAAPVGAVVQVAQGTYLERLVLTKTLTLEGGWNATFDRRDVDGQPAVIDGQRAGTVISISNASPSVDGFWITGGQSPQGGGVYIANAGPIIRNNVISGNLTYSGTSGGLGGGLYAEGNATFILLDANSVVSNAAHLGGGVLVSGTAGLTMTNNVVAHNTASQGGGVYAHFAGDVRAANNTFVQNDPSALVAQGQAPLIANNIVVSHTTGISLTEAPGLTLLPTHNLFYANYQNYAGVLSGTGDLVADPKFASAYQLSLLSPAIDRGVDWTGVLSDRDGQRRPIGKIDIGANEAGMRLYLPTSLKQIGPSTRQCPFSIGIWPSSGIPAQVGQAQELGTCWTRVMFYWDRIEPVKTSPRTYDWQSVDTPVLSLTLAGINPVGMMCANPPWAAAYPGGPVTDTQDVLDFLAAAAERYDGDGFLDAPGSPLVPMWELYNEPDNQWTEYATVRGRGYWGGRAAEYAQFLAQARAALRSANPRAQVAFGGLAHEDIGGDIFDLDLPNQVFSYIHDHPGEYFDFFNFHYFPVFGEVYSAWGPDILGKTNYFRAMMDQYGVRWPIIVTEAGYWNNSRENVPESWLGSYEDQARYVPQLYSRSAAADLKFVSWLLLFDLSISNDVDRGLSDAKGVPKPAYNAYKVMALKLGDTRFERALSPAELGTPGAEGYAFTGLNDSHHLYVVWATDSHGTGSLRVAAASALVSDKLSSQWPMSPTLQTFEPYSVADGDDGAQDGYTQVTFGSSPIYVEVE